MRCSTSRDEVGSFVSRANVSHNAASPSIKMTQRLPATLTSLDAALRLLLDGVRPVQPIDVTLEDSVGCISAAIPPLQEAHPAFNVAVADGWAVRALDVVGASSYSPVLLTSSPVWVEAGDRLPDGCDCILDADLVEEIGSLFQVLAEATPGHGIRRAGDDIAKGLSVIAPGRMINAFDVLAARAAGLGRIQIRSPRVGVIDVPSADGNAACSEFILEFAKAAGARAFGSQAKGRDVVCISDSVGSESCDLLVTVGGTGVGRTDETIEALASRGAGLVHGLALHPGRTSAVGRLGKTPVIAVPGAPDQAMAACLMLIQPALDRLLDRSARRKVIRPLGRKISSAIGLTEIVLLETSGDMWMPLATGQLSLEAIARADAWFAVPEDSEGYAAGTMAGAFLLRNMI